MALSPDVLAAIKKYGSSVDQVAAKYTNPVTGHGLSGEALLAKLVTGESGGDPNAVSSAGAKGIAQFMPGTRQVVQQKYGIDPWADADQAIHAAVLHLTGKLGNATGLEGYNPGSSSYTGYILGQKVGKLPGATATSTPSVPIATSGTSTGSPSQDPGNVAAVLSQLVSATTPASRATSSPALPSFAAGPKFPSSYASPSPGESVVGAQNRQKGLADLVSQATAALTSGNSADTAAGQDASSAQPTAKASGQTYKVKPGVPVAQETSEGPPHPTAGLDGYPAHDYFAPAGSAAVAPVSGVVTRLSGHDPKNGPVSGVHGPFGYSVYIKGDDGRSYYLTHLGSRTVKPGQKVTLGQGIGTVGDYAKWGGANHVHLGVSG